MEQVQVRTMRSSTPVRVVSAFNIILGLISICLQVSDIINLVSKHKDAYTYLNQSVEEFPYGDNFLAMMKKAGFTNLTMQPLTFGIAMLYIGDKI